MVAKAMVMVAMATAVVASVAEEEVGVAVVAAERGAVVARWYPQGSHIWGVAPSTLLSVQDPPLI